MRVSRLVFGHRARASGWGVLCGLLLLASPIIARAQSEAAVGYRIPGADADALHAARAGQGQGEGRDRPNYAMPFFSVGAAQGEINISEVLGRIATGETWSHSTVDRGVGGIFAVAGTLRRAGRSSHPGGGGVSPVYRRAALEGRIWFGRAKGDLEQADDPLIHKIEANKLSVALLGIYELIRARSEGSTGFYAGMGAGYTWLDYEFDIKGPLAAQALLPNLERGAVDLVFATGMRFYFRGDPKQNGLFFAADLEGRLSYRDEIGRSFRAQAGLGYSF